MLEEHPLEEGVQEVLEEHPIEEGVQEEHRIEEEVQVLEEHPIKVVEEVLGEGPGEEDKDNRIELDITKNCFNFL